jgi:hypothetical protein
VNHNSKPAAKPYAPAAANKPAQAIAPSAPAKPAVQPASKPQKQVLSKETFIKAVEKRAHEIYLSRGNNPGSALGDWLQAEKDTKAKFDIKE